MALDNKILQTLYTYHQAHLGDSEMTLQDLVAALHTPATKLHPHLQKVEEKGWLTLELTDDGQGGLINLTAAGQKVAATLPPTTSATTPAKWVLTYLPNRPTHFVGRETVLTAILDELQPSKIITLCGPGGIGKSTLAAHAIYQLLDQNQAGQRFPGGLFFYEFYTQPNTRQVLEELVRALGGDPRQANLAPQARRLLTQHQPLLWLDGCEAAENLNEILALRGPCAVLITSRTRTHSPDTRHDITPFSHTEAMHLLTTLAAVPPTDTAAATICEKVGYLPLAVSLVGHYLNQTGQISTEYLAWLEKSPIGALHHGEHSHESIEILLERSVKQVNLMARQVLGVVGVLAQASFDTAPIAAALAAPEFSLKNGMKDLYAYGLLQRDLTPPYRYNVTHTLIHTYAHRRLTPRKAALTALMKFYIQLAEKESEKGTTGFKRLDPERPHLLTILETGLQNRKWQWCKDLVWAIDKYLNLQGHWKIRLTVLEGGLKAAKKTKNSYNEAAFLNRLGTTYKDLGQVKQARVIYQQALALYQKRKDKKEEGIVLGNLGTAYSDLGQVEKAIDYYQQGLIIDREVGNRQGEGASLGNLGSVYHDLGQIEKAVDHYQQALGISRETKDRQAEGAWLGNLGNAYSDLGQMEKATLYYQQALDINQKIGYRQGEKTNLSHLGNIYRELGYTEKAIDYYQQAFIISQGIEYRQEEGDSLNSLGLVYYDLGQMDKAIDYYKQALIINQETGNEKENGIYLVNLGNAYREVKEMNKALNYLQQAHTIAQKIGYRPLEAYYLAFMGNLKRDLGEIEEASTYYKQAVTLAQEMGYQRQEVEWAWWWGLMYEENDPCQAAKLMQGWVVYTQHIQHSKADAFAKKLEAIEKRIVSPKHTPTPTT